MIKLFELNNNTHIPTVGLGTWKSPEEDAYKAVLYALEAGYRHIDTAMIYGNEKAVGKAIKDSKIPREEIFLTTKLWNTDQGYETAKKAIQKSLDDLGVDYVDLYLVHWFKGFDKLDETYKAMEEAYNEGSLKAIGVSNFNVHHLQHLLQTATVKPMVNQIETHIELQNHFLVDFCQSNNIVVEAYAPLMSWKIKDMLQNEIMLNIAQKHNKTVPQIAINWLNSRGIVALPKSVNQDRIISNFQVFDFELDQDDIREITSLNKGNKLFPEFDNITF